MVIKLLSSTVLYLLAKVIAGVTDHFASYESITCIE